MVERVQRRKESIITKELPIFSVLYNENDVRDIIYQRLKYENSIVRRNKKMSDFTDFITFMKSNIKEIEKMNTNSNTVKLINLHNTRIILLYRDALKSFNYELPLWKEYIKFLIKAKQPRLLQTVIDRALLLHGNISDSLFVFAVEIEIDFFKNVQKAREIYTSGLLAHKDSSKLYLKAFKCELIGSKLIIQELLKSGKELNSDDPALNGSMAKVVFESAIENVKNDTDLFFQMHRAAKQYNFSLDLSKEIKKFMSTMFNMDPNYWDTLAKNELFDTSNNNEIIKIIKCLNRYRDALSIVDTEEMWNKFITTLIRIIPDINLLEIYKINLIKESVYGAHKKNKLKPYHYIQLIKNLNCSVTYEILEWAIEAYPNDISISEMNITSKLTDKDELIAYELFKENADQVSPNTWLMIAEYFSKKPQISNIFDMAFGDTSVCTDEVKKKFANEYLLWLSKNKSLNDARNAYLLLITDNSCNASLCKTVVTLETEQQIIDISKIRQHFTLACMQFGKTHIDLWMERIYFELKYGSSEDVSTTYYQALTTLSNEESRQLAEQYNILKSSTFNTI